MNAHQPAAMPELVTHLHRFILIPAARLVLCDLRIRPGEHYPARRRLYSRLGHTPVPPLQRTHHGNTQELGAKFVHL